MRIAHDTRWLEGSLTRRLAFGLGLGLGLGLAAVPAHAEEAVAEAQPPAQPPQPTLQATPAPEVPAFHHVPVASAPADVALRVVGDIISAHRVAAATLHFRRRGEWAYRAVPFKRSARGDYEAEIPAEEMAPGVIEYWVGMRPAESVYAPEAPHFASPELPHQVIILGDQESRWRKELLARHYGNHSRLQAQSELVDFGARRCAAPDNCAPDTAGKQFNDYFWRVEADYTYRMLGWIYSIRLGAGVLRGATYNRTTDENGHLVLTEIPHAGLTYGFAELRFRFGRIVRLDLRATLGAGPDHFDGGAGAALIIGNDPGTNFSFGFDGVSTIGIRGFLKLAWNTVPRLPMSLTLEVTNLPSNTDARGRVFFGVGYRVQRHLLINAQLGYAARDFHIGGPAAGLGVSAEF